MKFIDTVLFVMILNLCIAIVPAIGLDMSHSNIALTTTQQLNSQSEEYFTEDGIYCDYSLPDKEQTFTCNLLKHNKEKDITQKGLFTTDVTLPDNDFLTGISMIAEIFGKGVFLPGQTYTRFFIDNSCDSEYEDCTDQEEANSRLLIISYLITAIMNILYLIALIQILSGRSMENNT